MSAHVEGLHAGDLVAELEATRWSLTSRQALFGVCHAAESEFRRGAWDDSSTHAKLALSLAMDGEHEGLLAHLHSLATLVPAARGDWPRARAHVEASGTAAQRLGDEASLVFAATAAAHVVACRHQPSAVLEALQPVTTLPIWRKPVNRCAAHELHADALVTLGRLADVDDAVEVLEASAAAMLRRRALAGVTRLRARLSGANGDVERARKGFEVAYTSC